ncbi:MAG: O-antigen ligase family protein [Pseudomonadales bacterium]|nr:O-antigen ligase family protein [Pseudomonadales bacterium]
MNTRRGISPKEKISLGLLCLYSFVVCFGNMFRFGDAETAQGLSTYIVLALIALAPSACLKGIARERFLQITIALVLVSLLSAFFYPAGPKSPLFGSLALFIYVMLAASFAGSRIRPVWIYWLVISMAMGMLVASVATIVDHVKIIDLPHVNEVQIVSHLGKVEAEQVSGFFARRSALAAFYSLYIPVVIIAALEMPQKKLRILLLVSAALAFLCLFLTHNRSGILSIGIILLFYLVFQKNISASARAKIFLMLMLLGLTFLGAITIYFPDHLEVYIEKLAGYLGDDKNIDKEVAHSDSSRVYFFVQALRSMSESLIGHGFSTMYTDRYAYTDPHNIFSHIIWASGIFGVAWIIYSSVLFKKNVFFSIAGREYRPYITAIKWGVMSWLLNNMTHNSLNMGMIWISVGLQLGLRRGALYSYKFEGKSK